MRRFSESSNEISKPETRPIGSVSLSFQTRPIERPLGSEILSSGSVSLSSRSLIFLIKQN
ncbi:hypothetical protein B2G51_14440 [Leptospira santarosai]|nr:hypothetical protein B2G51_14440 [Leptospira santarosai]